MIAKGTQCFALFRRGTGQGRSAVGRGLEQHRGFAANHFHVGFFAGAGVAHFGQLQYFAFGNDAGGLRQDFHHWHRAQLDHHFEGARVQEVADQYAWGIAPGCIGGLAAAAHAGHVHNIVVEQGRGVQELNGRGQQAQVVAFAAQGLAAQQH